MEEIPENREQWYALRVTYCRELAVKSYLDDRNIGNYLPMHWVEKIVNGKRRRFRVPLIHNLIFVRTSHEGLQRLKRTTDLPICYLMDRATRSPMVIPERQMNDFIAVVTTQDNAEIVLSGAFDLSGGDRVEVIEGPFKGVEGIYIRHKGRGRVAVAIHDIATALTAYIPLKFIRKTDNRHG